MLWHIVISTYYYPFLTKSSYLKSMQDLYQKRDPSILLKINPHEIFNMSIEIEFMVKS